MPYPVKARISTDHLRTWNSQRVRRMTRTMEACEMARRSRMGDDSADVRELRPAEFQHAVDLPLEGSIGLEAGAAQAFA